MAVTGGGGAVAPELAAAFLGRGWQVALLDRPGKEERVLAGRPEFAAAAAQGRLAYFGADLADPVATAKAFAAAAERFGEAEMLLNVAGGFAMHPAASAGVSELDRLLTINLRTAVNATAQVLPGMVERGSGFVLAVSAGAASQAAPGRSQYAAAKAALSAYFRSVAAEVGSAGVNVAVLVPVGTIDTPQNRAATPDADPNTWIRPAAVADTVLFLASRPAGGRVHELAISAR